MIKAIELYLLSFVRYGVLRQIALMEEIEKDNIVIEMRHLSIQRNDTIIVTYHLLHKGKRIRYPTTVLPYTETMYNRLQILFNHRIIHRI